MQERSAGRSSNQECPGPSLMRPSGGKQIIECLPTLQLSLLVLPTAREEAGQGPGWSWDAHEAQREPPGGHPRAAGPGREL